MNSLMLIDGVALLVILAYGFFGFRYGLTGILINLAGMVGGYIAVVMWSRPVAAWLAIHAGISPILAMMAASMLVFLGVTRLCYIIHLMVRRWVEGDRTGPSTFIAFDHWAGAGYGLAKGTLLAAIMLWAMPFLLSNSSLGEKLGLSQSHLVGAVQTTVSGGGRLVFSFLFDDPNAQSVFAHAVADPRSTIQETAKLVTYPKLEQISQEETVRQATKEKGVLGLLGSQQFETLLHEPEFQSSLRGVGFTPRDGIAVTPEDVARCFQDISNKLAKILPNIQTAATNSPLAGFLGRPDIQEKLRAGNLIPLLQDSQLPTALGLSGVTPPPQTTDQAHG